MKLLELINFDIIDGMSMRTPPTQEDMRGYLEKLHGTPVACSMCGATERVELIPADGMVINMLRSNLEPVCHPCIISRLSHGVRANTALSFKFKEDDGILEYSISIFRIVDRMTGLAVPAWYYEIIETAVDAQKDAKLDTLYDLAIDLWNRLTESKIKGLQSIKVQKTFTADESAIAAVLHSMDLVSIIQTKWQVSAQNRLVQPASAVQAQQPNRQKIVVPGITPGR